MSLAICIASLGDDFYPFQYTYRHDPYDLTTSQSATTSYMISAHGKKYYVLPVVVEVQRKGACGSFRIVKEY